MWVRSAYPGCNPDVPVNNRERSRKSRKEGRS